MPLAPADLTVVIPTRGRGAILERTLRALQAQTVKGFGVVVVVDGTDQPRPVVPPHVKVLQVEHGGPGAARNAGVAAVDTALVLFLGDDMVPTPALVEHHLARHERDGGGPVGVLGRVEWHPEVRRTALLRWIDRSGMQFDRSGLQGEDAGWGAFVSCNVSLPAAIFRAVGGFDPQFTFYYEDLDLAYRLREAGLVLRYERQALVEHLHSYDVAGFSARLQGVAKGEWTMRTKHDWFEPWYANRFRALETARPPHRLWRRLGGGRRSDLAWATYFAPVYLDAYEAGEEVSELREYLGETYDEQRLRGHQQNVAAEERAAPDEATFYRTSQAYLYDLTVFAMSGTKRPYRSAIRRRIGPGSSLLDYGCGIGSDGLRFIAAGYDVEFADFDNPSVAYLRHRLARRRLSASIHDVEAPGAFAGKHYELVYSFDVIEHVDDPFAFLARLESLADLVAVNFLEPAPDETHLHKELPIRRLLAHARSQGLVHYSHHYARSHFVIYHSRRTDPARRLFGRLRAWTSR